MVSIRLKKLLAAVLSLAGAGVLWAALAGCSVVREEWLLSDLDSESYLARRQACARLGQVGTARSVPVLFEKLVRESTTPPPREPICSRDVVPFYSSPAAVYRYALRDLGEAAAPFLLEELKSADGERRRWAADVLGAVAASTLEHHLESVDAYADYYVNDQEPQSLPQGLAATIEALGEALAADDGSAAGELAEALASLGPVARAALLDAFAKARGPAREAAARALSESVAISNRQVLDALKSARNDPSLEVRRAVLLAHSNRALWSDPTAEVRELESAGKPVPEDLHREEAAHLEALRRYEELLRGQLAPGDSEWRRSMLDALSELPEWSDPTAAAVLALVSDPDEQVELAALEALEGRDCAARVVPKLLELMESQPPAVRDSAIRVLASLPGEAPAGLVPALVKLVRDRPQELPLMAIHALGEVDGGVEAAARELVSLLGSEELRWKVEEVLSTAGGAAAPALVEVLRGNDALLQRRAAELVSRIIAHSAQNDCGLGGRGGEVAEALEEVLRMAGDDVCRAAAKAAGVLAACRHGDLSRLAALAADGRASVHLGAIDALAAFGASDPARALRILLPALREPDPRVVTAAVGALGRLGPRASEAAGVLRDLLRESESGEVRMQALAALRRITLDDRAAFFADLIRALGDRDSRVREAALAQAEEIGCDHAGPEAAALLAALKAGARSRGLDDDRVFRIVQRMRDWRAADVPLLLDIRRRSEDELLADEVRATLVGLARADASAVPPLVEALAVPRLRRWAISVLWDVGPNARAAAPFLRRIAESGAPEEQVAAAEALDAVEQEQSAKERGGPVKERR